MGSSGRIAKKLINLRQRLVAQAYQVPLHLSASSKTGFLIYLCHRITDPYFSPMAELISRTSAEPLNVTTFIHSLLTSIQSIFPLYLSHLLHYSCT